MMNYDCFLSQCKGAASEEKRIGYSYLPRCIYRDYPVTEKSENDFVHGCYRRVVTALFDHEDKTEEATHLSR